MSDGTNIDLPTRMKNLELMLLQHEKTISNNKDLIAKFNDVINDIKNEQKTFSDTLEQFLEIAKKGGGTEGGGGLDKEDFELLLHDLLTRDSEFAEFIARVAENTISNEYKKEKINTFYAKKTGQKKNGARIWIISAVILLSTMGIFLFTYFNSQKTIMIPAGKLFYLLDSKAPMTLQIDYKAKGVEKNNILYFEIDGKEYFYPLSK